MLCDHIMLIWWWWYRLRINSKNWKR